MEKDDPLLDIAETALVLHGLLLNSGTPMMQRLSESLLLEIGTVLAARNAEDQVNTIASEVSEEKPHLRLLD